jgi:uncharacterized membrane protein
MTLWQKRALVSTLIWSAVAIGFAICFFSGDGPNDFIEGNTRRNFGGGLLAVGIALHLCLSFLTRRSSKSKHITVDERDQTIRRRSSESAFNVLAVFVFLSCIALHDAFREKQGVPIGWLWFLAYSSFILAYLSQSLAATILYCSSNSSPQGEKNHE